MNDPDFDEIIHAPLRLQICVLLMPVSGMRFAALRDELDVADSVLSKHLKVLAEAGHVTIRKGLAEGPRPVTSVEMTSDGREAVRMHLLALERMARAATPRASGPHSQRFLRNHA